ncbi:hypothetical protein Pmani_019718 [Petrolisthes manimaculis]|uniref:Uncharacterized protein n=1 Tax=Petrolisthes manimaculis TaxID=1843537 RepID=A0AAE1U467_9EUCA|nr:hypothetical protein Pmani_022686 [Petrolisthes manimaculis]KAK4308609.1 hypothetical protein Pmani_019718 [Petrolisthes manimaculis]
MRSKKKEGALKPSRKLDKKSSRGVMFENEGLRMRTIEINAEVDRGQSDLRKLKRENETLKQQVWTLRDEYDKLESFVKKMDEESDEDSDDDDDDNDDDDDDDDELESRLCHSKIDEEEGEDEEGNVEIDNLENMQKVYTGKMRSVEYTLRQAATMDTGPSGSCSQAQCLGGAAGAACSSSVEAMPGTSSVRVCMSGDSPAFGVVDRPSSPTGEPLQPLNAEAYISQTEHFNLDQLLDFASSFHYDRRKHLAEEPIAIPLPSEEERSSSPTKDATGPDPAYSTVRRRSATVIEKLKSGTTTGAMLKEVKQLSLCKDDASAATTMPISEATETTHTTTTVNYTHSSYFFSGPLDGSRSQSLGTGLNSAANITCTPSSPAGPLYSSSSASNIGTSSSLEAGLPLVSVYNPRASLVRLNTIEPNTIMVSVSEMPQLWDITTQEIIDELEQQSEGTLMAIRGVRVVGRAAYISLGRRDALQHLMNSGLTVRGGKVPLIDITRESVVLALTGVPHYIADATLVILLAAFGTIIGELERRFYKGVDTGERFVRMKLKKHVKLPKYVTVGGCRIVLTVHGRDAPAQLHVPEWGTKFPAPPPPTPQPTAHASHAPDATHTDLTTPISPDSGQCSEPSSSDKSCERLDGRDGTVRLEGATQADTRLTSKSSKTFSSRCIVNLKLPERQGPANAMPRVRENSVPRDPVVPGQVGGGLTVSTGTPSTPLAAGHLLRAGSLYRSGANTSQAGAVDGSPISGRRHSRVSVDGRSSESPRPRPNSVVFDEQPREAPAPPRALLTPQFPQHHSHGGASGSGPLPLANGILRKSSGSEQEALLPTSHKSSIRNRLKIGRSISYDAGKQKMAAEKGKKKLGKMESISENTINDDVSDITPLGAGARRDSEKSSVSANSKSSSNTNKKKEPAIDLPWCGCWGNGCF